jgi:CBS domain-containing protein
LSKFLERLGARVRTFEVREQVKAALSSAGLATEPDWTLVDREGLVRVCTAAEISDPADDATTAPTEDELGFIGISPSIGALLPAVPPTMVSTDVPLDSAVTNMLTNHMEYLPVVDGTGALRGALTWKSYARMTVANNARTLLNAIEPNPPTIQDNADLLDAVTVIAQHGYVVVRNAHGALCGVLTVANLATRYRDLLEPFQKIGQIERTLRRCTTARLSPADFEAAFGPGVTNADKLSLGQYRQLLQDPARWAKFGLAIDRSWFCDLLKTVKDTRNELAHFAVDRLEGHQLDEVNSLLGLLRNLDPR